jgi:predicted nuclease of restriction endonuclease-like RecB superfamily
MKIQSVNSKPSSVALARYVDKLLDSPAYADSDVDAAYAKAAEHFSISIEEVEQLYDDYMN